MIAAPTGSGKTLAAFLAVINDLIEKGVNGSLQEQVYVVYVSPLKALSNDIQKNLQAPLQGIKEELKKLGLPEINIKAAVRSGDTPQSERTAMIKKPPHIIVTTPESLFLLLTSVNGRKMLSNTTTLILDEIHAVVEDKRGAHLSLSIERLEHLSAHRLTRVGISATQKPIIETAKYLVGKLNWDKNEIPHCKILDKGHQRQLDLAIDIPDSPLSAIMSNEMWEEVYDKIENYIHTHTTTIIFVNTRRMAERISHDLKLKLGEETVTSHHGSLSKEQRLEAEELLKNGQVKALVATASLELGIDIGHVDLVIQIGSPRSIAAFLQRVGRSGHSVIGVPKGRLFVTTRDELIESTALLYAVQEGELDALVIQEKPVDILAQQIIAMAACDEWNVNDLFHVCSNSYTYRSLDRKTFDDTLEMLTTGFTNRRGYKRAYIHYDKVNQKIRARKGARLAVLQSGGAIPDLFDFDVIMEPTGMFVGTVNEDFAIESLPGDIFQLGNSSWRVSKVENGILRVEDAHGLPPTIPFWFGEAPGRTIELSEYVSKLREKIDQQIDESKKEFGLEEAGQLDLSAWDKEELNQRYDKLKDKTTLWLTEELGLNEGATEQIVNYLLTSKLALGALPTQNTLILERFFDDVGDMHLIIHSTFGSDMNSAWGLALRKRFCRGFNFELQAAATEDCIILSLSQTHSFVLADIYNYLKSKNVRHILTQAMLDAPMFEVRWRWNATRAMAILRRRNGKKVPATFQRMEAEDLVAVAFPDQIACLENIVGDREIPDHPLVLQTIHDCLTEAMDIDLLEGLIKRIENNDIRCLTADLREPSPLSQEVINARPYAFLDEAPAEERRTRAIQHRSWMDPADAAELARLNPEAIEMVSQEAWPRVDDMDELHDALVLLGYITEEEMDFEEAELPWNTYLPSLIRENRAFHFNTGKKRIWVSAERLNMVQTIFPKGKLVKEKLSPPEVDTKTWNEHDALVEVLRGRLESSSLTTVEEQANLLGIDASRVTMVMLQLEAQGFVFQGKYSSPDVPQNEWCERRLLHRIHKYTLQQLRKEIEPVTSQDFMRFLFEWHKISTDIPSQGPVALQGLLDTFEGYEAPAASWESEIIPGRIKDYDPSWMDILSLSGRVQWGRIRPYLQTGKKATSSPIKTTPIVLFKRGHFGLFKKLMPTQDAHELNPQHQKVLTCIEDNKACFFDEIVQSTGLLKTQVEEALDHLTAAGFLTSDSFTGLRALLTPVNNRPSESQRNRRNKKAIYGMEHAGRWTAFTHPDPEDKTNEDDLFYIAKLLLNRYGVVTRKVIENEKISPPWRNLVRVFRRLEARGEIRGGRFIASLTGEQYALPEALAMLRAVKKKEKTHQIYTISAVDPLNFTGVITPGRRISNLTNNKIMYRDGIPIAVKESGKIQFLQKFSEEEEWQLKNKIIKKNTPSSLKAYLGKYA